MLRVLLLTLSILLSSTASLADVSIVTTITPLKLIAESVVDGHGEVSAIVDAQQSPHHFTLSPSDRVALAQADIALWIGQEFEIYLADFFSQPSLSMKSISAIDNSSLTLYKLEDGQTDAHLWMDSGNALQIARVVLARVQEIDPENAENYSDNFQRFTETLAETNEEINKMFEERPTRNFAVYHNAFQYFEKQFGLNHTVVLLRDPESQPSIREILKLRQEIQQDQPRCLLLESDASPELVRTILDGYELDQIQVDLLGNNVTPNGNGYSEFMLNLAGAFRTCLY